MPTFWRSSPGARDSMSANRCSGNPSRPRRFTRRLDGSPSGSRPMVAITIDAGSMTACARFALPNSRHPKTGLFKRRIDHDALMSLSIDGIRRLAEQPAEFDLPDPRPSAADVATMRSLWSEANAHDAKHSRRVRRQGARQRAGSTVRRSISSSDGAGPGDRHRLLFSAAANLAEFGCSPELGLCVARRVRARFGPESVRGPPSDWVRACSYKRTTDMKGPGFVSAADAIGSWRDRRALRSQADALDGRHRGAWRRWRSGRGSSCSSVRRQGRVRPRWSVR